MIRSSVQPRSQSKKATRTILEFLPDDHFATLKIWQAHPAAQRARHGTARAGSITLGVGRGSWLPGQVPHDFRRTAIGNMLREAHSRTCRHETDRPQDAQCVRDLIAKAGSDLSKKPRGLTSPKALASDDLSTMFGIEIAPATPPARSAGATVAAKRPAAARSNALSGPTKMSMPATPEASAPERRIGKQQTPAKRQAISARMRTYWAARRQS
jgi:hypothetical protein